LQEKHYSMFGSLLFFPSLNLVFCFGMTYVWINLGTSIRSFQIQIMSIADFIHEASRNSTNFYGSV
jgi:hypothetical protein